MQQGDKILCYYKNGVSKTGVFIRHIRNKFGQTTGSCVIKLDANKNISTVNFGTIERHTNNPKEYE